MTKKEKAERIVKAIDRLIQEGFALSATEWKECNCGTSGCGFYEPTWRTQKFYDELCELNTFWNASHIRYGAHDIIEEDE